MCGIVGLFVKNVGLQPRLGAMLADMLLQMTERGPDSAGFAVYGPPAPEGFSRVTVLSHRASFPWDRIDATLKQSFGDSTGCEVIANHAVLTAPAPTEEVLSCLNGYLDDLSVTSSGTTIVIFKEKGSPRDVIQRFQLDRMGGSHALGHTRMATESAVTTEHSHPFSTGLDLCLVHNGSLSNHNRWRNRLRGEGISFQTDNDSEVAAGYLMWRMREGATLDEALAGALSDLDGFYTFAIGSRDGFAVLRDPIACKPAILAETADWVAMASEFRAIAQLPGVDRAKIWEPAPGRIYSWHHSSVPG